MTLLLSDEDTKRSIDMPETIDLIEETCRQQVAGHDYYGERLNFGFEHGWMRLMPAVLGSKGVIGYKEFHPSRDGMRMTYHLIDIDSVRSWPYSIPITSLLFERVPRQDWQLGISHLRMSRHWRSSEAVRKLLRRWKLRWRFAPSRRGRFTAGLPRGGRLLPGT